MPAKGRARILMIGLFLLAAPVLADQDGSTAPGPAREQAEASGGTVYKVGVDDVLTVRVTQPEELRDDVTVSPDGCISFTYIGEIPVNGKSLVEVQREIEYRLSDGYLEYPVVSVTLTESRSRRFFVYGEVVRPGAYSLEDKTTVLRAISMAGGFTKFGSRSRVKLLRPKKGQPGYDTIKVNIRAVMDGDSGADLVLENGDVLTVSIGMF